MSKETLSDTNTMPDSINSNSDNDIVITSMGAITAVGANVKQTAATIKAGIAPFAEHAYYECTPGDPEWDEGLPAYVAAVPSINPYLATIDRFTQLTISALDEVFVNSELKRSALKKMGLLVALPPMDTSTDKLPLNQQWLIDILGCTGLAGLKHARVARNANIGMFSLIDEAMGLLQSGQLEQCIVGGVDSYLLESRMAYYDQKWRIKSSRNVDGFIPGEASVMLMLESRAHAIARGATPLSVVGGVGFGIEVNDFHSKRASSGVGLTEAVKAVLNSHLDTVKIHTLCCDLNGESYYSQEVGLVHTRLGEKLSSITGISHPADCCGDVGAAFGGLLILDAVENKFTQKHSGTWALLCTANDDDRRSALLIRSA